MERKYYLRGLGLGIAVTAVIMGIATPNSRAMTNDEIIARAKELGLVENTVLSDMGDIDGSQKDQTVDPADVLDAADQSQDDLASAGSAIDTDLETGDAAAKEDGDAADKENVSEEDGTGQEDADSVGAAGEDNSKPGDTDGKEEQKDTADREENSDETGNSSQVFKTAAVQNITINSGDSSYTVAKKLADAGVITSAESFDTFLCQNGYDKRLRTGTFSISTDASDEQIARIVTGME